MIVFLNSFALLAFLGFLQVTSAAPTATFQPNDEINVASLVGRAPSPKRGLPFNNPPKFIQKFSRTDSQVNWAYSWDSWMAPDFPRYLEFIPMLWGVGADKTGPWRDNVNSALSRGTHHLFSFNEPDHCWNGVASCMSPQSAVDMYRKYMIPFASRASLGAPAVTSDQSGGLVGLNWLRDFLGRCHGCKIDFVPIHWYGGYDQEQNFRQHIQNARDISKGKPIWITEFKAAGTKAQQIAFLRRNLPWLDNQPYVARYAWFWAAPNADASPGALVRSDGSPSTLGQVYAFTPFGHV